MSANFGEGYRESYDSLAGMWSRWNREYFDADFPRLFVRFEDIIYNAEQVMQSVAQCAGLSVHHPYRAMLKPSKDHGSSSSLLSAMIQYGTTEGRLDGMFTEDVTFSRKSLDNELMQLFHYSWPETNETKSF